MADSWPNLGHNLILTSMLGEGSRAIEHVGGSTNVAWDEWDKTQHGPAPWCWTSHEKTCDLTWAADSASLRG